MSACISRHGEYSAHEPDDNSVCALCGVWECTECGDVLPPPLNEDDHFNCNWPSDWPTPQHADTHVCPECATGKHRNCDGDAWCLSVDRVVPCECDYHEPHQVAAA